MSHVPQDDIGGISLTSRDTAGTKCASKLSSAGSTGAVSTVTVGGEPSGNTGLYFKGRSAAVESAVPSVCPQSNEDGAAGGNHAPLGVCGGEPGGSKQQEDPENAAEISINVSNNRRGGHDGAAD